MHEVVPLARPPAISLRLERARVHVYGNASWWSSESSRYQMAQKCLGGASPTLFTALPPSPENDFAGRFKVDTAEDPGSYQSEGLVFNRPQGVGITWGRDCYFVVLEHIDTGAVAFAHVGRDSLLIDPACSSTDEGIISHLVQALVPLGGDRSRVVGFVGGGISAHHFPHPNKSDVAHFVRRFRDSVGVGGRVNLAKIIISQLVARGVNKNKVYVWDTCSYEDPRLGSYRAERNGVPHKQHQNVFVVYRP